MTRAVDKDNDGRHRDKRGKKTSGLHIPHNIQEKKYYYHSTIQTIAAGRKIVLSLVE